MFYAIKYAYGSRINNVAGGRADKAYQFSLKKLRDAWVAAGPPDINASGYRANGSARDALIRKADYLIEGDAEAWRIIAEQRVDATPALARYRSVIWEDWSEGDHAKWVATAPEAEIVSWARDTAAAQVEG